MKCEVKCELKWNKEILYPDSGVVGWMSSLLGQGRKKQNPCVGCKH